MDFDGWDGERYKGLPYVRDAKGLVAINKKGKELDWSNAIPPEKLNDSWILIEKLAYIRSFKSKKALVYCVRHYVDSLGNSSSTEFRRGYFYHHPSLESLEKNNLGKGARVFLQLLPSRLSLYATSYLTEEDKEVNIKNDNYVIR